MMLMATMMFPSECYCSTIPPTVLQVLEEKWREVMVKPTGCRTYEELRAKAPL